MESKFLLPTSSLIKKRIYNIFEPQSSNTFEHYFNYRPKQGFFFTAHDLSSCFILARVNIKLSNIAKKSLYMA